MKMAQRRENIEKNTNMAIKDSADAEVTMQAKNTTMRKK